MKILLTGAYSYSEQQLAGLRTLGADFVFVKDERQALSLEVGEIDAVVCNGLFLYNDIADFHKLKLIQTTGAGLERLPLPYIQQHHIALCNARGVYSVPMAEFAVLGTLLIYKQSIAAYENQKQHRWQKNRALRELTGKRVLIVGTGSVGTECAKRFSAFGAVVSGVDLNTEDKPFFECVYPLARLEQQLKTADVVVLTLPLSEQTRGMFSDALLSSMQSTAVLVNIARGAILDENALICALAQGRLGGAVLDVFEQEPLAAQSPLWDMPNVVITPHNSFVSDQTADRMFQLIYSNLKAFIEKEGKQ